MPAYLVFHEGNALTLHALADDCGGLALACASRFASCFDLFEIVSVDNDDVPAERFEFLIKRSGVHDVGNLTVDLETVPVDECAEVIELVVCAEHSGFPNLTFLGFAVADDGVNAVSVTGDLCGESHARCGGNAETERTGGHINAGGVLHIGVTLKEAVDLTESGEVFLREVAFFRESRIESGSGVTLGENEAVTVSLFGVGGIHAFDAAVSVESLHHFTKEEKVSLYHKLRAALKDGGYFILTDYFASCDEDEKEFRGNYEELKRLQGIDDDEFYHYDTPLTVAHETEAFIEAGFSDVELLGKWGNTYCLKVSK